MLTDQPTSTPLVTVLMTLHNKGDFVEEAVQSVLASSFTDLELLVVDDASTDGGPQRLEKVQDPRFRLITCLVNQGRPRAANIGFNAARGRYVAILDADDRMHPERLAKQVDFLDAHPEVGVCGSSRAQFGDSTQVLHYPRSDTAARALSLFGMPVSYGACMLRRSVLDAHGIRCPEDWSTPGMDYLFMLEVGEHTAYANLQEVLTDYRVGNHNMRYGRDAHADAARLFSESLGRLGIPADRSEVALHVLLAEPRDQRLGLGAVWALYRWKQKLERLAPSALNSELVGNEINRRWDAWFHRLVQVKPWSALLHMLLSGALRHRAGYWASCACKQWLGSPLPANGPRT